jgi:hypothetical protein
LDGDVAIRVVHQHARGAVAEEPRFRRFDRYQPPGPHKLAPNSFNRWIRGAALAVDHARSPFEVSGKFSLPACLPHGPARNAQNNLQPEGSRFNGLVESVQRVGHYEMARGLVC